jgi:GNAT superfamily N-acetyltransferase
MAFMSEINLQCVVREDQITRKVADAYDLKFDGVIKTSIQSFKAPNNYRIGLIVGPSGSGKSTLLKIFGEEKQIQWDAAKSIVSHFDNYEIAQSRLCASGLNSIPAWLSPYQVLSTGEKFRADLSARIESGCVIDEFTSVVDRSVAMSCCYALNRYIQKQLLEKVVFASCHHDIIDWLCPDWVYDTLTKKLTIRGLLQQPSIQLEVIPCGIEAWSIFSKHHYLSADINQSASSWLCFWGTNIVGFASSLAFPSGTVKNAYREHRTVVLPDFQGMGIGVRLSDAIAKIHKHQGFRYFSKTTHPRMGEYRNNSSAWSPTSKNMKIRNDKISDKARWTLRKVFSYSHEYIGIDDAT